MTGGRPAGSGGEDKTSRENESTRERVERLVAEGKMTAEAVANAERVWRERLADGIDLPTGARAVIALSDLYHVIVDDRIRRKPERIEHMLLGVFEVRTTELERRIALTRWTEEEQILVGLIILEPDNRLRSLHVVDDKRIRREQNKGIVLWRQQRHTYSGPDPKTTC